MQRPKWPTLNGSNLPDGEPIEINTGRPGVSVAGNHVYFYTEVADESCVYLLRELRQLESELFADHVIRFGRTMPPPPIWLHILSPGGSVFAATAVADQLKQLALPVYSVVEGYCASAATLISMSCSRRYAQPSAMMLLHQLQGETWGHFEKMKDEMKMLEMVMEMITTFYVQRSRLDRDAVQKVLQRESWYTAAQCLENGFVDEVLAVPS
jgi:ATP-dependent protease ClpP protease subunit